MTKKARVLFIFATVFTALAVAATVFFTITETSVISSIGHSESAADSSGAADTSEISSNGGGANSSYVAGDVAGEIVKGVAEGFAGALVFVIILVIWGIASLVFGVPAIVMNAFSVKHTKIAIAELVVSIICTLSPLIFLAVFKLIQS